MASKDVTPLASPYMDLDVQALIDSAIDISELGIDLVLDKATLVDRPFYVVEWDEKTSQQFANSRYSVVRIAYQDAMGAWTKGVFVAGGSLVDEESNRYGGIVGQLDDCFKRMANAGATGRPIFVSGGLACSEYTYSDDAGNNIPAKTYYLKA